MSATAAADGEVRSLSGRLWRFPEAPPEYACAIAQRHGLPEVVGRVLAARGVALEEVPRFVAPRIRDWLPDPSHLHDLDRACARLAAAIEARERVGLIGDYDVDGASATALLGRYLRRCGCPLEIRIPDRLHHGYGPHPGLLDELAATGVRLVVVLDAGTTAFDELEHARRLGLEVLVIDHHEAEERLPPACAVVNPGRRDQQSPLGDLAAVGVTFVLLVGLNRLLRARGFFAAREEPDLLRELDLVALGTVCDVVPLKGLNRAFVAQGLKVAAEGRSVGLRALAAAAGIARIERAWQLGFLLGPRLNAGGRLGRSDLAVRLLLAAEEEEARAFAQELDALNRERQQLEQRTLERALRLLEPQLAENEPVLLAAAGGWHPGVIGIVAGRLLERFGRPVFIGAILDGRVRGSARAPEPFDAGRVVLDARRSGLLEAGGGHPAAAGFALRVERLQEFHAFLRSRGAATFGSAGPPPPVLVIDGDLSVRGVQRELARAVRAMAPFGTGNPEPRFRLLDAVPIEARRVGENHIACLLAGADGARVRGIAFRAAGTPWGEALLAGRTRLWLAGRLKLDCWQGEERVSFQIEDVAAPR